MSANGATKAALLKALEDKNKVISELRVINRLLEFENAELKRDAIGFANWIEFNDYDYYNLEEADGWDSLGDGEPLLSSEELYTLYRQQKLKKNDK